VAVPCVDCDVVTGERFDVHKVILVSCSDYFRSMFTSGMKESSQREIELKGVTSKGLEKVIEVIYTSTTTLDGDDIFDVIGAATHMQVGTIPLVRNTVYSACSNIILVLVSAVRCCA